MLVAYVALRTLTGCFRADIHYFTKFLRNHSNLFAFILQMDVSLIWLMGSDPDAHGAAFILRTASITILMWGEKVFVNFLN